MIGDISIAVAAGTPDTAVFTWDTDGIADAKCAAINNPTVANCPNDVLNAYTSTTTGDQCIEKWELANNAIRCVRVRNSFSRPFLTTDTNAVDMDLGYRPFEVVAGWVHASQATAPLKMDFASQRVDFGRFLKPTPEADYNGAIKGLALTCSLVAGVLADMF